MKKMLLLITISLVVLFSGCASMEDPNPDPDPIDTEYITFVKDEFDYSIDYKNMYADVSYQHTDFFFVFGPYVNSSLSETEKTSLQTLFLALEETPLRMSILMNQDLEAFRTTLEAYDIEPTPELLLTFNLLKELYETLPEYVHVLKIDYIEYRLDRTLTEDEKYSLSVLEYHFNLVNEYSGDYPIEEGLLDVFIMAVESERELTEEEKDEITIGYNIMLELEE